MTYSVLIVGPDIAYIHQRRHTKEKALQIAKLFNDNRDEDMEICAVVAEDDRAENMLEGWASGKSVMEPIYFAILEDGILTLIQITSEMAEIINKAYHGDEEEYFGMELCEKYGIRYNHCEWSIVSEQGMVCYGKIPYMKP